MTNEEQIEKILHKKGELLPTEIFSWKKDSKLVAEYYHEYFDTEKYNWEKYSHYVTQYCPENLDPNKYNWKKYSWIVAMCCPHLINTNKFNWEKGSAILLFHYPNNKYIKYCIWNKRTIDSLKFYTRNNRSIWKKYKNQIDDLLDPQKREVLLNRIAKDIKIAKI